MAEGVSPDAIENPEFTSTLRGYDRDEVDGYVRMVAAERRRLVEASRTTNKNNDKPYRNLGEDVGDLLQHAKDSADRLKKKAEEEAARLREETRKSAREAKEKAEHDAKEIRAAAEYEAAERIKDGEHRIQELGKKEAAISGRLDELRERLGRVLDELDQAASSTSEAAEPRAEPVGDAAQGPPAQEPEEPAEPDPKVIRIDAEKESSVS
ncbi:MAG: DivIVA domain-containing protein [Actinomycetota bacterium]